MPLIASRLIPNTIKPTLNNEPSPYRYRRFPGDDISGRVSGTTRTNKTHHMSHHGLRVRAVVSNGDWTVESRAPSTVEVKESLKSEIEMKAVVRIKKKIKQGLVDKLGDQWFNLITGIGQGVFIQLISEEIDPDTNSGKLAEAYVSDWPKTSSEKSYIDEYTANFTVPLNFGSPGAILITNKYGSEFFLVEVVLHGIKDEPLYFLANSWIHSAKDNSESRIFFRNQTYLPSQTPPGIKILRRDDLLSKRGNGKGERKLHEMIYDYAPYNDLGNPDQDQELYRPVLGGSERPFPRRCRTGRPPSKSAPECESKVEKPHPIYIPRDETYEETKQETVANGRQKALLHNFLPYITATLNGSDTFSSLQDIDSLYIDGSIIQDAHVAEDNNHVKKLLSMDNFKYDIPALIKSDRFTWLRDSEFARQPLAGVNPVNIECLKEFPIKSKLDPIVYGPQESGITREVLEEEMDGMSVTEAIKNKRLFILNYHDYLLPFVNKINELQERKAYASRTVFFSTNAGTLRPVAIELSLPPTNTCPGFNRVYTRGHDDPTCFWLWKLAQAHVCAGDAIVHQYINHWMRTHTCMETYIMATMRQLSQMHPIYKLLRPHMRYTMQINALARQDLFSAGGIIEATYNAGKYGIEITSEAYKTMWRFDMEALPADLLRRGMAEEDPTAPCGIKLVVEDYPYAADGLLIWSAINEWVESYVCHFYSDSKSITSDDELQGWWTEIKEKGHPDKKHEPGWPKLESREDLTQILTTIIWLGSGQHAAMNFSQYPFGAYVPNRPTIMRKLIPQEDEPEFDKFLKNPQAVFLESLPSKLQAAKVIAVQENACTHSPDEEYLGHEYDHWFDDTEVKSMFDKYSSRLKEIEDIIDQRNKDLCLKNRTGAGVPPYELLLPSSGPGITGRGVPNSISI